MPYEVDMRGRFVTFKAWAEEERPCEFQGHRFRLISSRRHGEPDEWGPCKICGHVPDPSLLEDDDD
jgi:hypothetical protein